MHGYNCKVDIYSLGMTAIELGFGKIPFDDAFATQVDTIKNFYWSFYSVYYLYYTLGMHKLFIALVIQINALLGLFKTLLEKLNGMSHDRILNFIQHSTEIVFSSSFYQV